MTRKYTLTLLENHLDLLWSDSAIEHAAFLFCSSSSSADETRFLVQRVQLLSGEEIFDPAVDHIAITSTAYIRALKEAEANNQYLVLVHSHPGGYPTYSLQDDRGEADLIQAAFNRGSASPLLSLLLIGRSEPDLIGRIWTSPAEAPILLSRIRVVGSRLRIFAPEDALDFSPERLQWADRQVRAFGKEAQLIISNLHVGLVGAGGTGSAVAEQLIRLGVGLITVCDFDKLDTTNVHRVYGSCMDLAGLSKVELVARQAAAIGTGTRVRAIDGSISSMKIAAALRDCDLIIACTDDQLGRMILNQLSLYYYIPVIDTGFDTDSRDGEILSVTGRVTHLRPGSTCMSCRGRIDPEAILAEALQARNPEEYERRLKEGYIPELGIPNPAVVSFTTAVAAQAINELLHMITGFMGQDRQSTEVLLRFNFTDVGTSSRKPQSGCFCSDPKKWGFGDQDPFLGMTW